MTEIDGDGLLNDTAKYLKRKVKNLVNLPSNLIHGRTAYSPKVESILSQIGNNIISGITIHREPVPSILTTILGGLSMGQFSKNYKNSPYDTLFHLRLDFTFTNGSSAFFEKNEVINASTNVIQNKVSQNLKVATIPNISMNDFLQKGQSYMGEKFWTYSAKNNNCQDFVNALLLANGINEYTYTQFVKQNTEELFEGLTGLRKLSNTVTDVAGRADVLIQGGQIVSNTRGYINPKMVRVGRNGMLVRS
jgi:hypothetical protein